jgi:hypothetical protein
MLVDLVNTSFYQKNNEKQKMHERVANSLEKIVKTNKKF